MPGLAPGLLPNRPIPPNFDALVDTKLKEMSPERQQAVAEHLKVFLTENAERMSSKKRPISIEMLMVTGAKYFLPYVDAEKKHQVGFWKKFLAWEEMPDRPWNQEAPPVVEPGAEGGPAEKAEAEAAAGDKAGEPGEETFEARVERLWGLVMQKSPTTKAMKNACGVSMRNTITPENVDAFETFITKYEKK